MVFKNFIIQFRGLIKEESFAKKILGYFFPIALENVCCGYSLETPSKCRFLYKMLVKPLNNPLLHLHKYYSNSLMFKEIMTLSMNLSFTNHMHSVLTKHFLLSESNFIHHTTFTCEGWHLNPLLSPYM